MAQHDELGREVADSRPVEWPADVRRPLTIQEEIQRFVRVEMSRRAAEHQFESFDEADDFDVEDGEPEWKSPYEMSDMQEETPPPPAEPPLTSEPDVSKSVSNKTIPDKTSSVSSTGPNLTEASGGTPAGGPT